MEKLNIKDSIGSKEIILTDSFITYDGEKVNYQEVIDFNFYHSYINGTGGVSLTLKTPNKKVNIAVDVYMFMNGKKTQEKINKVVNLFNTLYPVLIKAFVQNSIKKIQRGEIVKVAKVSFNKTEISMTPRTSYWTTTISIPYKNAVIKGRNMGVGLFGSHGNSVVLMLYDNSSGKSQKYSMKASHQPSIGEITKAEELLNYIKRNNLFNSNAKEAYGSLL